jgi:hypothetical protein
VVKVCGKGSAQLLFSDMIDDSIANDGNGQCVCMCAPVCVFSVNFGVHCRSFIDDQHVQKWIYTVCFYIDVKFDSRS